MEKIPVRFNRVAAAFDKVARSRLCESSGSEHSPENSTDLYDLVNSFIERNNGVDGDEEDQVKQENKPNQSESESSLSDSETKDMLQSLLGYDDVSDDQNDDAKRNIVAEAELAQQVIGNSSSPGFKRRLMTRLRERGFDAGLCKSRWEKSGRFPSGDYEYIDVNVAGTRYIVEVFLAGEFDIARSTNRYMTLIDVFPPIFVGKLEELKQVVRLMCGAIKESMKSMDMHVPPWRRNGYMQAKWSSSHKRTINAVPTRKESQSQSNDGFARKQAVGFEASPGISYYCRDDFVAKVHMKVGYLAVAMNGSGVHNL